jgi:hypothetical protein
MKTASLILGLLVPMAVLGQPAPVFDIADPQGDDAGDGTLFYPRDSVFAPGDLDLRQLRAFAEPSGTRFEATFRNPIRDPAQVRAPGLGSENLDVFARRGFYGFNIDIYLDTDRIEGSGHTVTLPGRGARMAAAHAWDKAIVLTPRPELMKRQLAQALQQSSSGPAGDVTIAVDGAVHFATDVRVRGRTVSFHVPREFLDPSLLARSSVMAFVTAAKLTIEAEGDWLKPGAQGSASRFSLGVATPESGRPMLAFGYDGDRAPATAVIDVLGADARAQASQLASGGVLFGLNRDNQYTASDRTAAARAPVTAAAPTAVVAGPPAGSSWFGRALESVSRWFGAGALATSAAPAAAAPAASPPPVASAPVPAAAAPAAPAVAPPAPAPAAERGATRPKRDEAFYEEQEQRLRALKRLRDSGLITEDEYQRKRREILDLL